jgi:hypothetical protein
MKNFDKIATAQIKSKSDSLYKTFDFADKWVSRHLKYEEKKFLLDKIKKDRSEIRKINNSVESKPVFALFGVSQVGKSYLVKNLLSLKGGALEILCGDNTLDFLQKINPQGGGAESTGVVTRFSAENTALNNEYPVKLRLLTPKDLIILLCDSFFSDIKRMDTYPTQSQFQQISNQFNEDYFNKHIKQNYFTEDDVWDIKAYFEQNFNKFSHYVKHIDQSGFWSQVGEVIAFIPVEKWSGLFSLLWDNNPHITMIFNLLVEELKSIDFEKELFVSENAILRDEGAILDVQRLNGIFENLDLTEASKRDGQKLKINTCRLSALTSELTLNVVDAVAEAKPFLKQTDLLDFPGARGRLEWNLSDINEISVVEMFLRGKISFLFNKYSSDMEINNLMFCMKDEQIEVNELSSILHDWIQRNIGKDQETREKNIGNLPTSPLFIVFTFFNKQLKFDSINDASIDNQNYSKRWDNRFVRFFEGQIAAKYNWHNQWTESNPSFSNFYLLRDFHFSDDTFEGFLEEGVEKDIKPDRIDHVNKLKESFLSFPFVKNHLKDPLKSWDESASPSKDGSSIIVEDLEPAANNFIKVKNFNEKLERMRSKLLLDLEKHHISDNINDKRDKAFKLGVDIQFGLMKLFNSPKFHFGEFLKAMSIKDSEVFNVIHTNFLSSTKTDVLDQYTIFRSMFPEISADLSKQENLKIISSYLNMENDDEVIQYLKDRDLDIDRALENKLVTSATKLVDSVINLWESKLRIENFTSFIQIGLDLKIFEVLTQNLKTTFEMLNVRNELIQIFEQKTRMVFSPMDTEEFLASISSAFINDFVSNFGYNFMGKDRLIELESVCLQYKMDLSIVNKTSINHSNKINLGAIYDELESVQSNSSPLLENFNSYIMKIKLALLSNCGFVNYDVNANNELNNLINELEEIDFTIE